MSRESYRKSRSDSPFGRLITDSGDGGVDRERDHRDQFLRVDVLDVRLDELVQRELDLLETWQRVTLRGTVEVFVAERSHARTGSAKRFRHERAMKNHR